METHLHAVRQQPGESLWAFISCFTKVRGTIPSISDASIITAFRQGVRDEKMLEKLATHQVETVATLFALADKCARAAEGRAWHSAPQDTPGGQNSRGKRPRQQDGDSGSCSPSSSSSRSGGAQLQQIPARSIPHSCEEAHSGGKPTSVAPSTLRRKADSGCTKPALAESPLWSH